MSKPVASSGFIASVNTLPPLPTVALKIIDRLGDEFIDGNEIADIVEQDPGISGKLLGVANSAYFALPVPATEMRDVVNRVLGAEHVRTLAFGLATTQIFDTRQCPAFDAGEFWRRALLTANGCRRVAAASQQLTEQEREMAFVLGLCHRLGLLALAYLKPNELSALLERQAGNEDLRDAVTQEFGQSIEQLTAALALHWQMPDAITTVYGDVAERTAAEPSPLANVLLIAAEAIDLQLTGDPEAAEDAFPDAGWLAAWSDRLALPPEQLAPCLRVTAAMFEQSQAGASAMVG